MRSARLAAASLALLAAAPALGDEILIQLPGKETRLTLEAMRSKLKETSVTIEDPVYKKRKTYDGFPLLDVLKQAGLEAAGGAASGDEIVFTAKDGYSPNVSFAALRERRAYLVHREHGKKGFEPVAQGKAMVSPAPYYVVWEEGAKAAESVPWPYQLVKIEVVDFKRKYDRAYPKETGADSGAMKGFAVFKNHCIRCHSVNLQGGDLGPELNAPRNITEYWDKSTLKQFVRDATSFRYKSKMPPFPQLKDREIDQVLEYLEHMKGHKWRPS